MLQVRELAQHYEGAPRQVLQSVSFDVRESDVFAITGASGSGKSSLLRLLGGLEEPQSGAVFWKGAPVFDTERMIPGHPKIAFLEQEVQLPPNMSIRDTLRRELRMYDEPYQEKRLEELLRFCQLDAPERRPRQLSGGEQQRVGLARAVARVPEVLLLDEPFAHLDYPNKQRLRRLVLDLKDAFSLTIIFVTHHIREAFGLASRLLVLEAGRLVQLDTPTKIYNQPVSPRVARLFGATNILPLAQVGKEYAAFSHDTLAYVPPEFVQLSARGGQPARIERLDYMGGYFLVAARLREEADVPLIYFYTHQQGLQVGLTVQLRFVFRQLHVFSEGSGTGS